MSEGKHVMNFALVLYESKQLEIVIENELDKTVFAFQFESSYRKARRL